MQQGANLAGSHTRIRIWFHDVQPRCPWFDMFHLHADKISDTSNDLISVILLTIIQTLYEHTCSCSKSTEMQPFARAGERCDIIGPGQPPTSWLDWIVIFASWSGCDMGRVGDVIIRHVEHSSNGTPVYFLYFRII